MKSRIFPAFAVFLAIAVSIPARAETVHTDFCVYGGTSGGVAAAVTAARLGRSVVVIEPGRHLGGLSAGGLGHTDTGNQAGIGGISSEFYTRIASKYGKDGRQFQFEPHVAEEIFGELLEEHGIRVFFESSLVRVEKEGESIVEIETDRGDIFRAKMFFDTTYEGDLMAAAGVSYRVGREANSEFGETLNGVRPNTPKHQFVVPVDPYVIPGNPASGLLPYIQPGDGGEPGSGDAKVQAYNFRLCLTQVPENRIPIVAPPGYDAANYEVLGRHIQGRVAAGHSLTLGAFLKIDRMPNGKTDINNQGAFSTDFIGQNYDYPENPAARRQIWDNTVNYIKGLLHFLGTDPRIPSHVRSEMQTWGYCKDEFQDTGGFGHQMYVREARRMVSDYVMTQHNAAGTATVADPIGLGSYTMDSHNIQRLVQNGVVRNEGDVQIGVSRPYGIPYRSIVPARGECDNLFVTFCLSATHIAFGSARMEPVFMITSQSAATAAAFAIEDGVAVQDVDYEKLRLQLLADDQIITWGSTDVIAIGTVVDNSDAGTSSTGAWTSSQSSFGYYGSGYVHDGNSGKGSKSFRFTPNLPETGDYDVYLRWTTDPNRATNVPVAIRHAGGNTNTTVNQTVDNGSWVYLGTYAFDQGTSGFLTVSNAGTNGYVIADAANWVPTGSDLNKPVVQIIAGDPHGTEGDPKDPIRLTVTSNRMVTAPLTVECSFSGTATPGDDFPAFGSVTIPAGQASASIVIHPFADATVEGAETLVVALGASTAYQIGTHAAATVTIHDEPFDAWRSSQFTQQQLGQPEVSGEHVDPDGDGVANLAEFFGGGLALAPDAGPVVSLEIVDGVATAALLRSKAARGMAVVPEAGSTLGDFEPIGLAGPVRINQEGDFEWLGIPLEPVVPGSRFFRFRLERVQPQAAGLAFWSFDTLPSGTGAFVLDPTLTEGFRGGAPQVTWTGSTRNATGAGGAESYVDPAGTIWHGAGGATPPGHSLAWNSGSTGNSFSLVFSTLGQSGVKLRMDVRSAEQSGGSAPESFLGFTYDIGDGPQPVPGIDLSIVQDNQFHEWTADLSHLTAIENVPSVTLTWTFKNLASSPQQESVRVDNLLLETAGLAP